MKHIKRSFLVQGLNLERFINLACEEGLSIVELQRRTRSLRGLCNEDDFEALRAVAASGGWSFTPFERRGHGRLLDMLTKHWLMTVTLLIALAAACVLYQFVLQIELIGAEQYEADVWNYLQEKSIAPFTWKQSIDLPSLCSALEWRYPKVAWIECGWRGTTLFISFSKGVPLGKSIQLDGSGDVIASRDGIVESIVTLTGTPVVKAGEIVRKGQVLIKGVEHTGNEQLVAVAARGIVNARVWDGATVQMKIEETMTTYTGRAAETWYAVCPWFNLWKPTASAFEQEDVMRSSSPLGGAFLPIWLIHETYLEADVTTVRREQALLEEEASNAALHLLRQKIGFGDDFVDKWVDCCMIEDEVIEAVAIGERVIDIALPRRNSNDLTGKAAPAQ